MTYVDLINCERETVAFTKLLSVSCLTAHSWIAHQSFICFLEIISAVKRMTLSYDMDSLFRSTSLKLRDVICVRNYLPVLRHCLQTAQTQASLESRARIFVCVCVCVCVWRCGSTRTMASSFLRFVDHTQRHNTLGSNTLDE